MKLFTLVFISLVFLCDHVFGQNPPPGPLTHTFSIVARDSLSGEMGVAVQSHWFSVGTIVTWAEAGVGAVATQSFANPAFGPEGLALLKSDKTAQKALNLLIAADDGRDFRQLAIVDSKGNVATWTGPKCIADAGHITGEQFSVQANMMLNDRIWPAMAKAYREGEGDLADRLIAALEAAQDAGGDIRGKQSAAILIVKAESSGRVWRDRVVDLRVDDHPEPIRELKRLLQVDRAYKHMNAGDAAIEENDVEKALREYGAAEVLFPDNLEMKYWHAVSLANIGRIDEALVIFGEVFRQDENWRELTRRIVKPGLITVSQEDLQKILNLP